jgi:arabinose-5-phosphate isomerase
MASVVVAMTEKSMGAALVGAPGMIADGIITDGDLRRHARTLWSLTAGDVATPDPRRIPGDMPARDAAALMGREGILVLLVDCDDGPGLLHLHDCLAGGGAQA